MLMCNIFLQMLAVNPLGVLKVIVAIISGSQNTQLISPAYIAGSAMRFHVFKFRRVFHLPQIALDGFVEVAFRTKCVLGFLGFNNNGLQVFGSHYGAHTGAPGRMIPVGHNAAE